MRGPALGHPAQTGCLCLPPPQPGQTGSGPPRQAEPPPPGPPRRSHPPDGSHLPSAGQAASRGGGRRQERGALAVAGGSACRRPRPSCPVRGPGAGPGDPRRGGRAPRPPGAPAAAPLNPAGPLSAATPPGRGRHVCKMGFSTRGGGPGPPIGLQLRPATGLRDRSSSLCPTQAESPPSFTPGTPTARDGWVGPHPGPGHPLVRKYVVFNLSFLVFKMGVRAEKSNLP